MIRYITIDERPPQPGDVIRRGRRRLQILSWGYYDKTLLVGRAIESEVTAQGTCVLGETYGIGPCPEGGWQENGNCGVWQWWPPYRYEHRADGGSITHPIDAGAWV